MKKHRWFWVTLFIIALVLTALLATSWNVIIVTKDPRFETIDWGKIILGTLGFLAVVGATILFFVRLLMEMRLNLMQTEFLAKVSHELKSPITTLELTASMLKDLPYGDDEERRRLWQMHDAELKRLKAEVDLILETSRWEARPYRPELRPVRLESWLTESSSRWAAILGSKAELRREGQALDFDAITDPRLLELITNNIVDNARKFARDGKPRLRVVTSVKPADSRLKRPRWCLSFVDDGWGFEPKQSRKLFKRFYRTESGASHAVAGTGLGLYLARAASKHLGIKLTGHSDGRGKGATFSLEGDMP